MRNTELEEAQAGIKIARKNINNLRYADDTTLMAESEEELKSVLMKGTVVTLLRLFHEFTVKMMMCCSRCLSRCHVSYFFFKKISPILQVL